MDRIERIRQSFIPRKAERSDTHDNINRHDPDYQKHQQSKKQNAHDEQSDDLADVSIESLIIFLKGLVKDTNDNPEKNPTKQPINQSMKKAISAYGGNTPKPTEKRYTYLDDDDQDYNPELVKSLIAAMQGLKDEGYDHITLLKGDGFLKSIQKTVEKVRPLD